jgi:hypothetical protein
MDIPLRSTSPAQDTRNQRTPLLSDSATRHRSERSAPSAPRLSCCATFKIWSLRAASVTAYVLGGLSMAGTIPSGGAGYVVGGLQLGLGATLGGWARSVRLKEEAEARLRYGSGGGGGGGEGDAMAQTYTDSLPEQYYTRSSQSSDSSFNNGPTQVVILVQGEAPKPELTAQEMDKIFKDHKVADRAAAGLAKLEGRNPASTASSSSSSNTDID